MNTQRLKKLQNSLERPLLIKKKENLLYLTGRSFMHGYLLIKPRNTRACLPAGRDSDAERRGNESVVFLGDGLERMEGIKLDFLKNVGKYIGRNQTLEVFGEFTYAEVKYIRVKNPDLRLKILVKRDPVDYQRQIKDIDEIAKVRKSMQIVERVFGLVRREIKKSGMTEARLAKFIQSAGLKMGADDISFPAIVAGGANAAVPHHVPSSKKLKAGESIILDFGFKYQNYCSDFTRTVFLKKVPKRLEMAYNQVEKAYNESINFCNLSAPLGHLPSGGENSVDVPMTGKTAFPPSPSEERGRGEVVTGNDLYQRAVDVLAEKHLEKYFIHSLGHGTGLEIHELPNLSPGSKDVLKDGMVFSIEPGVYFPKQGGIRIEDLVYLEKGKVKKFINVPTKVQDNVL
jgi:Xaa-Pro aminopeptidase